MADNLALHTDMTLKPSDSDVTQDILFTSTDNSYTQSRYQYQATYETYLYNWHAAVAYPNGTTVEGSNVNPETSICPKGWQLPNGSGSKSYVNLFVSAYNASYTSAFAPPLSYKLTGYFGIDSNPNTIYGKYVTRKSKSSNTVSAAHLRSSEYGNTEMLNADHVAYKTQGSAIRCVAR